MKTRMNRMHLVLFATHAVTLTSVVTGGHKPLEWTTDEDHADRCASSASRRSVPDRAAKSTHRIPRIPALLAVNFTAPPSGPR
jgi:hypothetical protein